MPAPASTAVSATPQLVIHAIGAAPAPRPRPRSIVARMKSLMLGASLPPAPDPTRLQVVDMQGQEVFSSEAVAPLMVLRLPAGTYHVVASSGSAQRRYTLTLPDLGSFDLYVKLPPEQPR